MSETSLEERVRRLEDLEAIKDLTARYATYVDKGWNGKTVDLEGLRTIFAVDATWNSVDMRTGGAGVEEIVQGAEAATAVVQFSMHSFTNPVITVDGDGATATWLLWVASKIGGQARQVFMSEDVTYVRTTGGWRVKSVDLHIGIALAADLASQLG